MTFYLALILLAILQVADGYTTMRILANGGRELNPLMRKAFERFGIKRTLVIKSIGVVALGYFIGEAVPELLALLCLFYAVIVFRNYKEMKK